MSFQKAATYPPNPVTTRGRSVKVSTDRNGEKLVYVNEKAVVIRDLRNLSQSISYVQHLTPPTVARISPSGYYCASADTSGTLRVWDVAGSDQILKLESKSLLGGKANDLAWDAESKRIVVVGEGRESFGKAVMVDGGTSCGEISGHSKAINAVSVRSKRPFRAVTCSDDGNIVLMNGVPYKFSKIIKSHSSFVNDVQYAPSGDVFASVGADGKVFLYEGAEGEIKGELSGEKSKSSLYGLSFSPDSTSLATSSAAGIVHLYDPSTLSSTTSFDLSGSSSDPSTQQLGLTYLTPQTIASVSLSGALNILDARAPDQAVTLWGPTRGITATGMENGQTFWAGSFDGSVKALRGEAEGKAWEALDGSGGHLGQVVGFAEGAGSVWSAGWDDNVREVKGGGYSSHAIPTGSQPTAIASVSSKDLVLVSTGEAVDVIVQGKKIGSKSFKGEKVLSVAVGEQSIAVGTETGKVHLYHLSADAPETFSSAEPTVTFSDNRSGVYALAFSPDGGLLAAGESGGKIQVFDVQEQKIKISGRWGSHTGRITSLRWAADGKHCASASLDTNVFVWSVAKPLRSIKIANAHAGGATGVEWVGEKRIVSAGADATVRAWDLTFHA